MPKPVKRKRKFIRKSEATTFRLIPGCENETPEGEETVDEIEARKKEQKEFGVFYNDDYNYMKHLRSLEETATLVNTDSFRIDRDSETQSNSERLPPIPFGLFSTDENEEEILDPDILAALDEAPTVPLDNLDEDFDKENDDLFVEDDFIEQAGGVLPVVLEDDDQQLDYDSDHWSTGDDVDDSNFSTSEPDDDDADAYLGTEGQTRGTFQDEVAAAQTALILKNYEEGRGFVLSTQGETQRMPTAEDYEFFIQSIQQEEEKTKPVTWSDVLDDKSERAPVNPKNYIYNEVDEYEWKEVPSKPQFDCVSILSLNSNTRNLPRDIVLPESDKSKKRKEKNSRTESQSTEQAGLSIKELEAEMRESRRADKASTFRPKDETLTEKRERKKAIKDERKERRQEKKANKKVFTLEKERIDRETAQLARSVKSVKIQ